MSTDLRAGTLPEPLGRPAASDDEPLSAALHAVVARAAAGARATGRPVLASASSAVHDADPLAALHAAERAAATDPELRALIHDRMFWSHRATGVALCGLGAAAAIRPSGARRFADADAAWRAMLADAVVDDGGLGDDLAGPLLLGGFAFDPDGPRSTPWTGFGATDLVVPALQLAVSTASVILTLNVLVAPDGSVSHAPPALLQLRDVVLAAGEGGRATTPTEVARYDDLRPAAEWEAMVGLAVGRIAAGAMRKVVLARAVRATAARPIDALSLLDRLRDQHADAYVFGCWRGTQAFVGASPERLVRLAGTMIETSSLAGSAARGATPSEDAEQARTLLASAKDRAEHEVVRTFIGDALAPLCEEIASPAGPSLLTLPHVHHLHTEVQARLRAGRSLLEVAGALHPTPAVGGTPRAAALAFIREHEQLDRGWYAAPIGWVGRAAGELAVALRSALVTGSEAVLYAGCGIVAGSEPSRELAESRLKLRPMQAALGSAPAHR